MNTELECMPCLVRHIYNIVARLEITEDKRRRIMSESLKLLASGDMSLPPTYHSWQLYKLAADVCGVDAIDPYHEEKLRSIDLAWRLAESLEKIPGYRENDFEARVRLAVAGNVLDFSIYGDLTLDDARAALAETFEKPIDCGAIDALEKRMKEARKILYILDNCGEAVFDRFLMEPFREKITVCTRGKVTSNDVTSDLLEAHGLKDFTAGCIDNGECLAGIIPAFAGPGIRHELEDADLIICKGQGNFESMNDAPYPMSFLFMAKCPVMVRLLKTVPRSLQVINCF